VAFPKNPKHPYYQLPEKLAILSINELELSVRSYNALRYRTKTVGELVLLSDDKLLKIRDLGRKSLIDVRRALDEFMARHAGEIAGASDSLQPSIDEVRGQSPDARGSGFSSGGWRVPHHPGQHRSGSSKAIDDVLSAPVEVLDLSARSLNVLTKLKVRYVIELLEYPKRDLFSAENIGRKSLNEIESKLFAYLSDRQSPSNDPASEQSLANPSLGTKDFVEQILSRLPERQRNIIADRYGLWDGIAETLQDIGDKLGLTRERIRQIEARGIQRIRGVFGYGAIRNFVRENICRYVENKETGKFGVVNEDEAVEALAIGCTPEEAGLAIEFLQDISFPGGSLFGRSLIEIEPEVYAQAALKYLDR